ncbi:hypothetical protein [Legionella spiritensis]|uniref:Uncharacterized protein n=1 Tax=Legionella spiritensis TaxID=452 RepID=A0A0W0YY30_LEGSP|nr:hypothetical protein [Legionella spiritensis]KTD61736.1 hypothetical protein Lspi_2366 [Legionella spiritensis]SNV38689.1 Uncharacterised protein [Legionella spiritensis]
MVIRIIIMLTGILIVGQTIFAAQKPIVCTNTYALCNAADCQPIPGMLDKVLCSCSIWKGKNVGFSTCADRKERKTRDSLTALVSTFSFGGGHYKYMTCPSGLPWANCLDHPCLVDDDSPDHRRANCTCDVVRNQGYVTFAGECKTENCSKGIWSGASINGNQQLMKELAKVPGMVPEHAVCIVQ